MNSMSVAVVLILFFACEVSRLAAADDTFYTAGVVEFRPAMGMSSTDLLANHLEAYINILESAEAADTDIVVFPEGTLNNAFHLTYVPSDRDKIIPCLSNGTDLYADFLKELSCAARRSHKYVVINLTEKENCTSDGEDPRPCASNGLNVFNTNVVFDREGRVISRYRKVHVYMENKNTTYKPEFAIFETDFGVRFGHFICFDILFYTPAQELVERYGVTDFIFTSLFYSELPFLTAVQLEHGWAWGNNVNLLAAGASYPEFGMTGSGIYAGQFGDLVSVMASEAGERKLYKAKVPKNGSKLNPIPSVTLDNKPRNRTQLKLMKDPQIENYNSLLLDLPQTDSFAYKLCDEGVCCSFEIKVNILNVTAGIDFKYRVGVFDGQRSYENEESSDIKVCALYACANEEAASCGVALAAENILFKRIAIKGKFAKANKYMIMPSMLDDQLKPLKHDAVSWVKREQRDLYEVDLTLNREQTNIMTFGIYGNYYEKSPAVAAKPANILMLVLVFISLTLNLVL